MRSGSTRNRIEGGHATIGDWAVIGNQAFIGNCRGGNTGCKRNASCISIAFQIEFMPLPAFSSLHLAGCPSALPLLQHRDASQILASFARLGISLDTTHPQLVGRLATRLLTPDQLPAQVRSDPSHVCHISPRNIYGHVSTRIINNIKLENVAGMMSMGLMEHSMWLTHLHTQHLTL